MKSFNKLIIFLLLLVVFFLIATMYFRRIEVEDIWFHLKTGEMIVAQRALPFWDSYSYTSNHTKWLATQWLGDVVFYAVYRFFGLLGLQFFRCVFFTLVLALFFFFTLKKLSLSSALILTLAASFTLFNRLLCRPFIFSYPFLLLYFYILTAHHKKPFKKIILFIPFLQVVWQNIYIGGAYFSLAIIVIFLTGSCLDHGWHICLFRFKKRQGDNEQIAVERRDLLVLLGACTVCLFFNPYGIEGVLYPLRIFFSNRPDDIFIGKNFISEWKPSFSRFSDILAFKFLMYKTMIVISAVTLLVHFKKVCRAHILLFILFLIFSLFAGRLQDFFSILSGCIFAESFFDCRGLPIQTKGRWRLKPALKRAVKLLLGLFLFSVLVWRSLAFFRSKTIIEGKVYRTYGTGIDLMDNPEGALNFIDQHDLHGNIYNSYILGGFIIWREFPKRKVFIDGRTDLYCSSGLLQKVLMLSEAGHWEQLVKEYDIAIAILTTGFQAGNKSFEYIITSDKWSCVYFDGRSLVFLRNGKFAKDFLKEYKINLFSKPEIKPEALEEYRNNASRYPANFLLRSILSCAKNFPDPLEFVAKGNWLINLGSYDLAILQYLEALAINPLIERGDFWLGYCLYKKGDYDYAKIFAKRALEVSPSEPEALLLSAELNKQTDIPKAYLYYRYALKSNPHSAMVRELLADFAFSQGLDKEAIVQYHWLSRRFPADMKYLLRTAVLCGKTGKFNEARHLLEQAITVDPKNVDAHFNLAVAYRYLGLLNLSKKELKSTLSLNPGHPQARVYLGELEHL